MLTDVVAGFSYAWSGLSAIRTPGLRRFVVIPLLINIVVFALLIGLGVSVFEGLLERLLSFLPGWLDWLRWLLWPLFALTLLLVSVYAFTVIANFLASPFNGILSERFEKILSEGQVRIAQRPLIQELLRAPVHELSKLVYLLKWLLPAALLFLLPGLNVLAPLIWVLLGGWLLALGYMDYPMDNHGLSAALQRRRLATRRGLALGFGFGVLLMTSTPLLNFFAMPSGVLGATRMWHAEFYRSQAD